MKLEEYWIMRQLEDTYWWHRGMRAIMEQVFGPLIEPDSYLLDVGCGTGGSLAMLSGYCDTAGVDIHPEAVRLSRERGLENIFQSDAASMPFDDETFSHATCCGVLQSVTDDQACLYDIFRVLRPGGLLYVTEQAYPALWNRHDVSQGALRRYSRKDLEGKVRRAGFIIDDFTYANKVFLPLIAAVRLASKIARPPRKTGIREARSDLFTLPRPINEALYSVFVRENRNAALGRLPAGLTLVALARKPELPVAAAPETRVLAAN
ncbi:MAG: methyltransferase domain-containing protein [Thermoleophilia bacterium]